jgi:hypothetical protein
MAKKRELPDKWMKLGDVVNRIVKIEKTEPRNSWDRLLPHLRQTQEDEKKGTNDE